VEAAIEPVPFGISNSVSRDNDSWACFVLKRMNLKIIKALILIGGIFALVSWPANPSAAQRGKPVPREKDIPRNPGEP
jgi:hypothetical protein